LPNAAAVHLFTVGMKKTPKLTEAMKKHGTEWVAVAALV
jgi:hypothetical protein